MTCACGATFTTTLETDRCWECRVIGDPPSKRLPLPVPPLRSWVGWGTAGIGYTS